MLQHVEVAVDALVAGPFGNGDRRVVEDVDEARRITLWRHVDAAASIGGRDESQRRVRQPFPLDGRQPVLHLVGDVHVRFPDDGAEVVDGGDFVAHGYIMLACCSFARRGLTDPAMTGVVQNPETD